MKRLLRRMWGRSWWTTALVTVCLLIAVLPTDSWWKIALLVAYFVTIAYEGVEGWRDTRRRLDARDVNNDET